jgi:hypothetical protein
VASLDRAFGRVILLQLQNAAASLVAGEEHSWHSRLGMLSFSSSTKKQTVEFNLGMELWEK